MKTQKGPWNHIWSRARNELRYVFWEDCYYLLLQNFHKYTPFNGWICSRSISCNIAIDNTSFSILFTKYFSAVPISAVYYWICFPMILFYLPKVHDPFVQEKSVVGTKTQLAPSLWFIPSRIRAESPFLSGTAEWAMKLPFPGLLGAAESPVFSTG